MSKREFFFFIRIMFSMIEIDKCSKCRGILGSPKDYSKSAFSLWFACKMHSWMHYCSFLFLFSRYSVWFSWLYFSLYSPSTAKWINEIKKNEKFLSLALAVLSTVAYTRYVHSPLCAMMTHTITHNHDNDDLTLLLIFFFLPFKQCLLRDRCRFRLQSLLICALHSSL